MKAKEDIGRFCGGIWPTSSVAVQPQIGLSRWRVIEIAMGPLKGERHLVGYNEEDGEGRVSTAITSWDKTIGQCVTRSGRVYTLVGPAGYDPDGDYVWQFWLAAQRHFSCSGSVDGTRYMISYCASAVGWLE